MEKCAQSVLHAFFRGGELGSWSWFSSSSPECAASRCGEVCTGEASGAVFARVGVDTTSTSLSQLTSSTSLLWRRGRVPPVGFDSWVNVAITAVLRRLTVFCGFSAAFFALRPWIGVPIFLPSSTHCCECSRAPGVPESPGVHSQVKRHTRAQLGSVIGTIHLM